MDQDHLPGDGRGLLEHWVERLAPGVVQLGRYGARHIGRGVVTIHIAGDSQDTITLLPGYLPVAAPTPAADSPPTALSGEALPPGDPSQEPEEVAAQVTRGPDAADALHITLRPEVVDAAWHERARRWAGSDVAAAIYAALPELWGFYAEHGRGLPCITVPAGATVASWRHVEYLPLARWDDPALLMPEAVRRDAYVRRRVATFSPRRELVALLLEEIPGTTRVRPDFVSLPVEPDAGAIGELMLRLGTSGLGEHLMPRHRGLLN